MSGRYGYATYNAEEERKRTNNSPPRIRAPLSTAQLIAGAQKGNLHQRFAKLVADQNANNAARKAKKEANNALAALKIAQRKAFGVNQNSSAGLTRKGRKKEMTAKRMKKRQKNHEIKKAAIKAMRKQERRATKKQRARNKKNKVTANMGNLNMGGGPIVGQGLELMHSVGARKANTSASSPTVNFTPSAPPLNNNTSALVANLPTAPTHIPVSRKVANNKKNNKRAVALGGRRKTRKHKKRKSRKHKKRSRRRRTRHRRR